MPGPFRPFLGKALPAGLFVIGMAEYIEQLVHRCEVALADRIDGQLRQVIAEDVARVDRVHSGLPRLISHAVLA